MKIGMTPERRVQLKIDGGYDKHGDVFVIARPLTGSVSFPVKTFDDAKAREQFIEEFTFFRYGGQCPSWGSVLFANDCFSGEEKYSDTLKGENYTSERGKAYVLQLIASGELVVHCTGSWIPPGDRNHHLPWPTKPKEKEEFLPVVDHRSYALGPHDGPGSEHSKKTRTMPGGKVVPDSQLSRAESLRAKWGHLSQAERRELITQKAEASAERWIKGFENSLARDYPGLNPHFVDKHGPDIPLRPNLEQRSIDGSHPRTGTRGRPQTSSQFNDWRTQRNVLNEAITRQSRGLPRYNSVDRYGNPQVTGSYPGGAGRGFSPNRRDRLNPNFNPNLENWTVRFNSNYNQPFTAYPSR